MRQATLDDAFARAPSPRPITAGDVLRALDGEWRDQREIEARCGVPPPRGGRPFVWTEEDFRNLGMSIDVGRVLYGLLDGGRAERRQEVGGPAEWRSVP